MVVRDLAFCVAEVTEQLMIVSAVCVATSRSFTICPGYFHLMGAPFGARFYKWSPSIAPCHPLYCYPRWNAPLQCCSYHTQHFLSTPFYLYLYFASLSNCSYDLEWEAHTRGRYIAFDPQLSGHKMALLHRPLAFSYFPVT